MPDQSLSLNITDICRCLAKLLGIFARLKVADDKSHSNSLEIHWNNSKKLQISYQIPRWPLVILVLIIILYLMDCSQNMRASYLSLSLITIRELKILSDRWSHGRMFLFAYVCSNANVFSHSWAIKQPFGITRKRNETEAYAVAFSVTFSHGTKEPLIHFVSVFLTLIVCISSIIWSSFSEISF